MSEAINIRQLLVFPTVNELRGMAWLLIETMPWFPAELKLAALYLT
jgi:hypothetical protein